VELRTIECGGIGQDTKYTLMKDNRRFWWYDQSGKETNIATNRKLFDTFNWGIFGATQRLLRTHKRRFSLDEVITITGVDKGSLLIINPELANLTKKLTKNEIYETIARSWPLFEAHIHISEAAEQLDVSLELVENLCSRNDIDKTTLDGHPLLSIAGMKELELLVDLDRAKNFKYYNRPYKPIVEEHSRDSFVK